jgi:hypothetical protein
VTAEQKGNYSIAFLDKVRRLYPLGVPVAAIAAPRVVVKEEPQVACAVYVISERDSSSGLAEMSAGDRALIEAICGKGLRLPMDACVVRSLKESPAVHEELIEEIQKSSAKVALVFGGACDALGRPQAVGSTVCIQTHPLDVIANTMDLKKEFWRQLQSSILPVLHRE